MADEHDTRRRLLDAAVEVLATEGERAIKVRDIAAAAGVTEPSLYHFFGSREGLIEAAQARRFGVDQWPGLPTFVEAVPQCADADEFWALVLRILADVHTPERKAFRQTRLNVLGSSQSRPSLERLLAAEQRAVNEAFASPLRFAQERGWIRADADCLVLAVWIAGQINGRLFMEIDDGYTDEQQELWNRLSVEAITTVLRGP